MPRANVATLSELLGKRLKHLREIASFRHQEQIAQSAETTRPQVAAVESGRENFTCDFYGRLLKACGYTPEAALAGFDQSGTPAEFNDLYLMLTRIIKAAQYGEEGRRLVDRIRVNLEAISEKAKRIKRAHAPPRSPRGSVAVGSGQLDGKGQMPSLPKASPKDGTKKSPNKNKKSA